MPFRAATVRERAVIYINYPLADARGYESCFFIKNCGEIIYKETRLFRQYYPVMGRCNNGR